MKLHVFLLGLGLIFTNAISQATPTKGPLNWNVSDSANFKMKATAVHGGTVIFDYTRHDEVTSVEGQQVWMSEKWKNQSGQIVRRYERLYDRVDGRLLLVRMDGKDLPPPYQEWTEISHESTTVTVPAGTFDADLVKATGTNVTADLWSNTQAVPIYGLIKGVVFLTELQIQIVIELLDFNRTPQGSRVTPAP